MGCHRPYRSLQSSPYQTWAEGRRGSAGSGSDRCWDSVASRTSDGPLQPSFRDTAFRCVSTVRTEMPRSFVITDVPAGTVTLTHRFAGGVVWIGWSGWKRDGLVVFNGRDVAAFF